MSLSYSSSGGQANATFDMSVPVKNADGQMATAGAFMNRSDYITNGKLIASGSRGYRRNGAMIAQGQFYIDPPLDLVSAPPIQQGGGGTTTGNNNNTTIINVNPIIIGSGNTIIIVVVIPPQPTPPQPVPVPPAPRQPAAWEPGAAVAACAGGGACIGALPGALIGAPVCGIGYCLWLIFS